MRNFQPRLAEGHSKAPFIHLVTWRDPEPILDEPKPWHPDHRPHVEAS